jgi:uncharacterized membrane protein
MVRKTNLFQVYINYLERGLAVSRSSARQFNTKFIEIAEVITAGK